jgi:hypothetical protein
LDLAVLFIVDDEQGCEQRHANLMNQTEKIDTTSQKLRYLTRMKQGLVYKQNNFGENSRTLLTVRVLSFAPWVYSFNRRRESLD